MGEKVALSHVTCVFISQKTLNQLFKLVVSE